MGLASLDEATVVEALPLVSEVDDAGDLIWANLHVHAQYALYWGEPQKAAKELEHLMASHHALAKPSTFAGQLLHADLAELYQAAGLTDAGDQVLATPGLEAGSRATLAPRMRSEILRGHHEMALTYFARATQARGIRATVPASWQALKIAAAHFKGIPADAKSMECLVEAIERTHACTAMIDIPAEVRAAVISGISLPVPPLPEIFPGPQEHALTARETEVLAALRKYATANEIAAVLHISPNTVKTHLRTLYAKLGAHSRAEALRWR